MPPKKNNQTRSWFLNRLIISHIIAILLLLSFLYEPGRTYWLTADDDVFRFFNDSLKLGGTSWRMLWALTNNRLFDLVSGFLLVLVFIVSGLINGRHTWVHHLAIISVTVIAAFIGTRVGHLLIIERASATVQYSDVFLLSEWASFKTKDMASNTFPGDHGMVAMVVVGYAFHYLKPAYVIAAILAGVISVMPRIVGGAHWFSDEAVGALFVAIIVLSWSFHTPLSRCLILRLERFWNWLLCDRLNF